MNSTVKEASHIAKYDGQNLSLWKLRLQQLLPKSKSKKRLGSLVRLPVRVAGFCEENIFPKHSAELGNHRRISIHIK